MVQNGAIAPSAFFPAAIKELAQYSLVDIFYLVQMKKFEQCVQAVSVTVDSIGRITFFEQAHITKLSVQPS